MRLKGAPSHKILFTVDLIQDIAVLRPLLKELSKHENVEIIFLASARGFGELKRSEFKTFSCINVVNDVFLKCLNHLLKFRPHCVVTPVESNLGPHKFSRIVTRVSNLLLIPTVTLQHGLENIGLTYSDQRYRASKVKFYSKHILTWVDRNKLVSDVSISTLKKVLPVGLIKETQSKAPSRQSLNDIKDLLIFENLHWERFSKIYIKEFEVLLDLLCESNIFNINLKPHPAGQFYDKRSELSKKYKGRINTIGPSEDHKSYSNLISSHDVILSTPSTCVLDAALLGKPVVVLGFDLVPTSLYLYNPLKILDRPKDIFDILRSFQDSKLPNQLSSEFIEDNFLGVQGAERASRYLLDL